MFNRSTKRTIIIAASALMGLILLLIAIGVYHLRQNTQLMERFINEDTQKSAYLNSMYQVARERTQTVLRMMNTDDIFELDEERVHMYELASSFMVARDKLLNMPLSDSELALLEKQNQFTSKAAPVHGQVMEKISAGNIDEAKEIMHTLAIPAQEKVLQVFDQLIDLHQHTVRTDIETAKQAYSSAMMELVFVAILFVAMGVVITGYLIRKSIFSEVALQSIGDAVITLDTQGRIQFINAVAEDILGESLSKVRGEHIDDVLVLIADEDKMKADHAFSPVLEKHETLRFSNHHIPNLEHDIISSVDLSAAPIYSNADSVIGAVITFRDVTEERQLRNQLSHQASHDPLTGLINRLEFERRLAHVLHEIGEEEHTLIYFDLDQFKVVNDTCGHVAGDALLQEISHILKNNLRSTDRLARLGGDEFAVVLEYCSLSRGIGIAETLLDAVRSYRFNWEDKIFSIGSSFGVVAFGHNEQRLSDVLSHADAACYAAKNAGRNRIHVYTEDDETLEEQKGQMNWVSRINEAIEKNQLELFCQSIVMTDENASPHKDEGYEVLIRMKNEDGTHCMPGSFLPAAERYNIIRRIDRWVVGEVFSWIHENRSAMKDIGKLSVNLSGQSIGDGEFLNYVQMMFNRFEVNPESICFEITETAAIGNLHSASNFIHKMKSMGCYFSLDDFGSGLSSFAYLKELPVDYLKIDGLFVKDILIDPIDEAMVRSICDIGNVLGKKTVAEFVESQEIREKLKKIGIDLCQGYGISRPFSLDELAEKVS